MSSKGHPIDLEISPTTSKTIETLLFKSHTQSKIPLALDLEDQAYSPSGGAKESENLTSREAKFIEIIQEGSYEVSCKGIEINEEIGELLLELRNSRTITPSWPIIDDLSRVNARINDFFSRKLTFNKIHIKISKEALLLIFILLPISIAYAVQITV